MYYDDGRKELGDMSSKAAALFAKNNGFDLVIRRAPRFDDPIAIKPRIIDEYLFTCDRLIYVDADVLLNPQACADDFFQGDFNISTDAYGLCVGFMALRNTPMTQKIVHVWAELGVVDGADRQDQSTMKMLVANFSWISKQITYLPMTLISNPECKETGTHAHHFWSQFHKEAIPLMTGFKFRGVASIDSDAAVS